LLLTLFISYLRFLIFLINHIYLEYQIYLQDKQINLNKCMIFRNFKNYSQDSKLRRKKQKLFSQKFKKMPEEEHPLCSEGEEVLSVIKEISWQKLKIGDIIILQQGDIAPADVLILDMKEEFMAVDESCITAKLAEVEKKSPNLTKSTRILLS